jgi:hypothetical protein
VICTKLKPIGGNSKFPYYIGFHPGGLTKIPRGFFANPGYGAFCVGTILEQDLAVIMRDGVEVHVVVDMGMNARGAA